MNTNSNKKFNRENSSRFHIHSGVPQGSILGPLLYVLYTSDVPTFSETTLGTFANDTTIFATHEDPTVAKLNLPEHLHIIEKWLKKWKVKVKESKSSHIKFTLRKGHCPAVNINQTIVPQTEVVKYPGTALRSQVNPLNPELNPICYLLALLAHHFLHVSRIRVKSLTLRLLMSYIYIWSTYSWCF